MEEKMYVGINGKTLVVELKDGTRIHEQITRIQSDRIYTKVMNAWQSYSIDRSKDVMFYAKGNHNDPNTWTIITREEYLK